MMKIEGYTEGPWRRESYKRMYTRIVSKDGIVVASDQDYPCVMSDADAELIALAPQMYELLCEIFDAPFGQVPGWKEAIGSIIQRPIKNGTE